MAEIKVGKNETLDSALRRFKRATQKAGILSEVRNASTMKSRALHVRKNPKQPENVKPDNWRRAVCL